MATLVTVSSFGQSVELANSNIVLQKIDGPYSYKSPSDVVAIIGFVTEIKGADDAVFRDCNGNTRSVKRRDLKRIQRNCPSESPATPWIIDAKTGKLVPAPGYSANAYGNTGKAIDTVAFPADYKAQLNAAKQHGEPAAMSWAADKGKVDLGIIRKPEQQ
jgi:hypothetical protein